jgi:phosphinothricin acetyltransferase
VETTVYVNASACRQGIGRALYQTLLRMLREQGFRSALAGIVLTNPRSVRLHTASGFKPIGVHENVGFKHGRWHDIAYWGLNLADTKGPPREPIPFAAFKETPAFATALGAKEFPRS